MTKRKYKLPKIDYGNALIAVLVAAVILTSMNFDFLKMSFPLQVFSSVPGMLINSITYTGFDSNYAFWAKGPIRISATAGIGGEGVNAYTNTVTPQDVQSKTSNQATSSKAFTISTEMMDQKCSYDIHERTVDKDVYSYMSTEIACICATFNCCTQQYMDEQCTGWAQGSGSKIANYKTEETTVFTDLLRPPGQWKKSLCVIKQYYGVFGDVTDPFPEVSVKVTLDNGVDPAKSVVLSNAQGSTQYPTSLSGWLPDENNKKAFVMLKSISGLGQECKKASDYQVAAYKQYSATTGYWQLINSGYMRGYNTQEATLISYMDQLPANTVLTATQISTLQSKVTGISKYIGSVTQPYDIQVGGFSAVIDQTQQKAVINLPKLLKYAELILDIDADYVKVYKPVADLKIVKLEPASMTMDERLGGSGYLQVTNPSDVLGTGTVTLTCEVGFAPKSGYANQPVSLASKQTTNVPVEVSGRAGSKGICKVCLEDVFDRECRDWNMEATAPQQCVSGNQWCEGLQAYQCVNGQAQVKGSQCASTQTCTISGSSAVCSVMPTKSCQEICVNEGFKTGKCETVSLNLLSVPFIGNDKNMGYGVGGCGQFIPPQNCLCTNPIAGKYPWLIAMLSAMILFTFAYYKRFNHDLQKSLIIAALPFLVLYLLVIGGYDVASYEESLISRIATSMPTPWVPSTFWVVALAALLGAGIGLAVTVANIIPGDEPIGMIVGAVVLGGMAYFFKTLLEQLQSPLSILIAIASVFYLRDIIKERFKNLTDDQTMILTLISGLGVLITSYFLFWYGVIILLAIVVVKAVVANQGSIVKAVITTPILKQITKK
jgi:hypothetical protein